MNPSTRVVFNTGIQYLRNIVSVVVSLFVTRLILDALGVENYGIYAVVGGVVAMLSFIQSSLSGTTQRYLSFHQGRNDITMQKKIFNNSVLTQLLISVLLIFILITVKPVLFGGFLNMPEERREAAVWVYYCMLISLFLTMQSTPYMATLIAHENILYATIVQLVDTFLKIPIALSLTWFTVDRLKLYAVLVVSVQVLNFMLYYLYSKRKYPETTGIRLFSFDKKIFLDMFFFMGWTIYSTGCVVGRTQGIALVLNRFFGTAMNAAYGLSLTVSGQLSFLSTSLRNAINPQIIKAEGAGDRQKMLRLSEISSKFSFILLAIITIPGIIEMDSLLSLWLKEVPDNAIMFCQFVLLSNLIDQLTSGLITANKAIGDIRNYSLIINTIKLLTVPAALLCLYFGLPVVSVMVCYVLFELICAIARLPFLRITAGLSIKGFTHKVFISLVPPTFLTTAMCFVYAHYMNAGWSFLGTFVLSGCVMVVSTFLFGLCKDEKRLIYHFAEKILKR
ncbi:MAG: hypothetical protein KUL83_09220 [Lentimicrobium sp.]|nr:hypothetical protein [Lentimicrobium sp.]